MKYKVIFIGNVDSPLAIERFKMVDALSINDSIFYDRNSGKLFDRNFISLSEIKKFTHFNSFLNLIKIIKKYKINIIHFHGVSVQLLALSKLIFPYIKIISTPQGSDINQNFKGKNYFFTKFLLNSSSLITVKSKFMYERVRKICNNKNIVELNWGINNIFYENETIRDDYIYIVSPRTNRNNYNIDKIFHTISHLKCRFNNIKFIYISLHEENSEKINLNLADEIYFKLSPLEMKKIYNKCDFIISIPNNDGFSTSIMEALICGCLPIISNLESYNELNESYMSVLKVDSPYEENLLFKISQSIFNIDEIRNKIELRKSSYLEIYSKENQIKILKKIYEEYL